MPENNPTQFVSTKHYPLFTFAMGIIVGATLMWLLLNVIGFCAK